MYLRVSERRNRDGSATAYYALAENVWNATAKRSEVRVVHSFGRADQLDKAALQHLVAIAAARRFRASIQGPRTQAEARSAMVRRFGAAARQRCRRLLGERQHRPAGGEPFRS